MMLKLLMVTSLLRMIGVGTGFNFPSKRFSGAHSVGSKNKFARLALDDHFSNVPLTLESYQVSNF